MSGFFESRMRSGLVSRRRRESSSRTLEVAAVEGHQRVPVGGPLLGLAERVEAHLQRRRRDSDLLDHQREHGDRLGVDRRLVDAEPLGADLVELAQPAALRALVPEHGAEVVPAGDRLRFHCAFSM